MALDLLTERVSQPGEAAIAHSDSQVLSLDIRCADVLGIRVAGNRVGLAPQALRGAVACFTIVWSTIDLNQHRKVYALRKGVRYCAEIHLMPVCRHLNKIRETARYVIQEVLSRFGIAWPDHPTDYQFGIGVNGYEGPRISSVAGTGNNSGSDVLLLRGDKGPQFVDLNTLRFQIADRFVQVLRTSCAKVKQELLNGVFSYARHAYGRTDRVPFYQSGHHFCPLVVGELVHD